MWRSSLSPWCAHEFFIGSSLIEGKNELSWRIIFLSKVLWLKTKEIYFSLFLNFSRNLVTCFHELSMLSCFRFHASKRSAVPVDVSLSQLAGGERDTGNKCSWCGNCPWRWPPMGGMSLRMTSFSAVAVDLFMIVFCGLKYPTSLIVYISTSQIVPLNFLPR